MKLLRKFLCLTLMALTIFTLSSCSSDYRNQSVPYGSISDSTVVATAGDYSITQKQLYDRLKYNYGYTVLTNKLNELIYADEYAAWSYSGEDKVTVDEDVAVAIFSSSSATTIKAMTEEEILEDFLAYIDSMSFYGITLTEDDLDYEFVETGSGDEIISFTNLPEDLILYYAWDLIIEDANIAYLDSIADLEYIEDEDDDGDILEVTNDYYITETDMKNEYEDTYMQYYTAHGIVLRFNTYSDAMRLVNTLSSEFEGTEAQYIELYNTYHSYLDEYLDSESIYVDSSTTFVYDDQYDDLGDYSDELEEFFTEALSNSEGLTTPRNIDGSYYLVYRYDLVYTYTESEEQVEYADLLETCGEDIYNDILKLVRYSILESNASSVTTDVFNERMLELEIQIYDPYLENTFANSYDDYEYVTDFDNDLIFSSTEFDYTVDEFYEDLLSYNVTETVIELLLNQYLYYNEYDYLDDDDEDDLRDEIKDNIKDFKKGNTNLSKLYGESNYLFYNYGFYTVEEVVINEIGDVIKELYIADYIYDAWGIENDDSSLDDYYEDGDFLAINTAKLNVLQNILDKALEIYAQETDYIEINIDHILISVDNDGDGEADDMDVFLESLSDEEKIKFEEAITELAKAILKEVEAISDQTNIDILNYIVDAFNRNYYLSDGTTWDIYKTYNFILTVEELGDVDSDGLSSYVEDFQDFLLEIYNKLIENGVEIDEDDDLDALFYSGNGEVTFEDFDLSDLCQTSYGYHLISVNSYDEESDTTLNFAYTSSSDADGDYAEIEITLNEDDELYIKTDTYNDDSETPSLNQVLVYYIQYLDGDVTGFRSSIANNLSTLLDDVIDHYQNSTLQEYLLIKLMGEITITEALEDTAYDYDLYMTYLMHSVEGYNDEENLYLDWYTTDLDWSRS